MSYNSLVWVTVAAVAACVPWHFALAELELETSRKLVRAHRIVIATSIVALAVIA